MAMYELPGQSYWRALELSAVIGALSDVAVARPVLEIGCADGQFAAAVFRTIDDGIDINPRSLRRAHLDGRPYLHVHLMDARNLAFPSAHFGTVFANSVIEHISDLPRVLAESHRVLRDGGTLITTVPLAEMNRNLAFSSPRYVRMRQRQLSHINLYSEAEWRRLVERAGFDPVLITGYINASQCRLWDRLDAPICIGFSGRANIGLAVRVLLKSLPAQVRGRMYRKAAAQLTVIDRGRQTGPTCAAVIIARKR